MREHRVLTKSHLTAQRAGSGIAAFTSVALLASLGVLAFPGEPRASALSPPSAAEARPAFHGYVQIWGTVLEQAENGIRQPFTGDKAAEVASGLSIRRARIAADLPLGAGPLGGRLELKLEGSPALLDAYLACEIAHPRCELRIGQMKIPSTYEVATPNEELDFATRSRFSEKVAGWSLSRSAAVSSPLNGVRTYYRDLGIALRADWGGWRHFLMVGNGLGANLFIGAEETRQFIYANPPGAYFLGFRFSCDPLRLIGLTSSGESPGEPRPSGIELGGHLSRNRHRDMLFGDTRTVIDLDRTSWSVDLRVELFPRLRVAGMWGEGSIEDDFDHDGRIDYAYRGWELKGVAELMPRSLEAGLRYDVYWDERSESGDDEYLRTITVGMSWKPAGPLRLQAQYQRKVTESATDPDLDDDLFLILTQLRF